MLNGNVCHNDRSDDRGLVTPEMYFHQSTEICDLVRLAKKVSLLSWFVVFVSGHTGTSSAPPMGSLNRKGTHKAVTGKLTTSELKGTVYSYTNNTSPL